METFRNTLLIALVLLLVFVLYQRLLRILGKKKNKEQYAFIEKAETNADGSELSITMNMPVSEEVQFRIHHHDGSVLHETVPIKYSKGIHTAVVKQNPIARGKYYIMMHTGNQQLSQYFEIV